MEQLPFHDRGPLGRAPYMEALTQPRDRNRAKRRFCASYPDVSSCRRGWQCAFAHCREEIQTPLFEIAEEQQEPEALTVEFLMYRYKTLWCPLGEQHEWHTCVYAHNYQDARRPIFIGYGSKLCPYWNKKETSSSYAQRCPLGLRCPYSHGAKEQLYHPQFFKTVVCNHQRGKTCPRKHLCSFFHNRKECRLAPVDEVDYSQPLDEEAMSFDWVVDFLSPPFLREANRYNNFSPGLGTPQQQLGQDAPVLLEDQFGNGSTVYNQNLNTLSNINPFNNINININNMNGQNDINNNNNDQTQETSQMYMPIAGVGSPEQQPMLVYTPLPMNGMGSDMQQSAPIIQMPANMPLGAVGQWVFVPLAAGETMLQQQ